MADPILVSQIISSLGLTGKEAETKRQELEKLSNDELNKLIANIPQFKKSSVGGFASLEAVSGFSGNVFNPDIINDDFTELKFGSISSSQELPPPETLIQC